MIFSFTIAVVLVWFYVLVAVVVYLNIEFARFAKLNSIGKEANYFLSKNAQLKIVFIVKYYVKKLNLFLLIKQIFLKII